MPKEFTLLYNGTEHSFTLNDDATLQDLWAQVQDLTGLAPEQAKLEWTNTRLPLSLIHI